MISTSGGQLVQQPARPEPVGHHHVGLGQQPAAAHGDQVRVAGPAADQRHARGAAAVVRRGQGAVAQALQHAVADVHGAARVAAADHRDGDAVVPPDRRGPRGGVLGRVGARAEHPAGLGLARHRAVDRRVVGGGHGVPGLGQVAVPVAAAAPSAISPPSASASIAGVASGATTSTSARASSRPRHAALGDRAAADHHRPPAGQPQRGGVDGGRVRSVALICRGVPVSVAVGRSVG